ncbi:VOC family protein [Oceanobacillus saliphilus]|uniref:VOC family protein n=1 Tax=Oceanobacillus saliphilus TaxID=2925834 RepID=UPI00201DC7D7|nr:VOC family protein [Oceanobacillus saliphilus]
MSTFTKSPIKNKIGTVFIHVKNLKKSVEWYGRVLGVDVDLEQVESPVFNIPINGTTGLTLDDHTFDKSFKHAPSPNPIANFLVDDIDVAYEFIKENGVEVVREIERVGENFAWFNFSDPDGNVIMACTN